MVEEKNADNSISTKLIFYFFNFTILYIKLNYLLFFYQNNLIIIFV